MQVLLSVEGDDGGSGRFSSTRVQRYAARFTRTERHPRRSSDLKITVETTVDAPIEHVWRAWTTPEDITQWNAASDDWHTPRASVDLREGGTFSSRMEAKDGSMGFDFAGTYTRVVPHELIECALGDRVLLVEFIAGA